MAIFKTPRRPKRNPFMVTTGGQSVPYRADELEGTWQATARHAQRQEEAGSQYRVQQMKDGNWHIVDVKTGIPTGKYGASAERAQQLLGKLLRRTNPRKMSRGTEQSLTQAASAVAGELTRALIRRSKNPNLAAFVAGGRGLRVRDLIQPPARPAGPNKGKKAKKNPSPVPGISVEEVVADIDGAEWANWDLNRAGIMHWQSNPKGGEARTRRAGKRGAKGAAATREARDVYTVQSEAQILAEQEAEMEAALMRRLRQGSARENPMPAAFGRLFRGKKTRKN